MACGKKHKSVKMPKRGSRVATNKKNKKK